MGSLPRFGSRVWSDSGQGFWKGSGRVAVANDTRVLLGEGSYHNWVYFVPFVFGVLVFQGFESAT